MNKCIYRIFLYILIFSVMFLTGCDTNKDIPSSSASAESDGAGTVLVSSRDNGSSKQLSVGESLEVSFLENLSDGTAWSVDSVNPAILYQASEEFNSLTYGLSPFSSNLGSVSLRFIALKAGQTPLILGCRKLGFGRTGSPIDTFELQVTVVE